MKWISRLGQVFVIVTGWAFDLAPSRKAKEASRTEVAGVEESGSAESSDEELVRMCLARGDKDERPFRQLFQRHQGHIWRTCYRFVQNPHDAEDLTQEVFFKAYRALAQFEGRASFKTWLQRIAVNTGQNELRCRSRRPQEAGTPIEDLAEWLPEAGTFAADRAVPDRQEDLAEALAALRPGEVEVLQLKDLEERPYAEVAHMLDISLSAAKMRVQRARLALAMAYQELETAQAGST